MNIGIVIGRFQVPELTLGHKYLLDTALSLSDRLIVLVGKSEAQTKRNPLPFELREKMISSYLNSLVKDIGMITVMPLNDHPIDAEWVNQIHAIIDRIRPEGKVFLFGGRDSCLDIYSKNGGKGAIVSLDSPHSVSGSQVREFIQPIHSSDFRAGMIYKSQNEFPRAYPVVDVIIRRWSNTSEGGQGHHMMYLVARKPTDDAGKWRFIGGFVDPTDITLETAAKREVREETGLEVSNVKYVGSTQIDDWRYRKGPEKVISSLFMCDYVFGGAAAKDDISEVKWLSYNELEKCIHPVHAKLLEIYKGYIVNESHFSYRQL